MQGTFRKTTGLVGTRRADKKLHSFRANLLVSAKMAILMRPLEKNKARSHLSICPRNWPTDTIVATCNPDDDNNYGHAMINSVSGFAARTDEHRSDLLDHMIPHSVSDSRRRAASQQA
jgi:hypothetical protein